MRNYYNSVSSLKQYYDRGYCTISASGGSFNSSTSKFTSTSGTSMTITLSLDRMYFKHIEFSYTNATAISYKYNSSSAISLFSGETASTEAKTAAIDINGKDEVNKIIISITTGTGVSSTVSNMNYFAISDGVKKVISKVWFNVGQPVDKDGKYGTSVTEKETSLSKIKFKVPDGKVCKSVFLYQPDDETSSLTSETFNSTASVSEETLTVSSKNSNFGYNSNVLTLTNAYVYGETLTARNMKISTANGS